MVAKKVTKKVVKKKVVKKKPIVRAKKTTLKKNKTPEQQKSFIVNRATWGARIKAFQLGIPYLCAAWHSW